MSDESWDAMMGASFGSVAPTDLIAQAEAVMEGVSPRSWKVVKNRDGSMNVISGPDEDGDTHKVCLVNGADASNARFIAWCRAGVPALIARIRELEGERDAERKAKQELALDVLAASGQAQEAYEAQLAAEAHIATLTAQVEAMRGALVVAKSALEANAEANEEVLRRLAALTTENQTNG